MKIFFSLLLLFLCPRASADQTVAVIDTGIDSSVINLCNNGHKDFTNTSTGDTMGHGTHVAGLINRNAGSTKFCIFNLKFYSPKMSVSSIDAIRSAIKYAMEMKVNFINISGGGPVYDREEASLIKEALDRGIKIVVAAGNNGANLDNNCSYYPACYDKRLIVVGNLTKAGLRSPSSNYGSIVKVWEVGTDVESNLPNGNIGVMTGTSQATAVHTGKLLKYIKNK